MLDRKLLRELYNAKGTLLAIASIMSVGVACYVSMQSVYYSMHEAQMQYYAQCRMADFWIGAKKIPLAELAALEKLPGVSELHTRIEFQATVDLEAVLEPVNGMVISLPEHRRDVINGIVLQRGSYFSDTRDNEVIVNHAFAERNRVYPGQIIHVLINNRRQELFVVGTAVSSEFTYLLGPGAILPDPAHYGVFYVKHTFAEDVFDFAGATNSVMGLLSPEVRDNPDDLLQQAEMLLEDYGVASAIPRKLQASNQYLSNEIDGLRIYATALPIIFLSVAALVLNVLLTRLARQQRVSIGTLKALGYTDGQIFTHFLKFGICVGLCGGLLGCLLGYLLSAALTSEYRRYFEFPELPLVVYPLVYAIAMLISLVCAAAGSVYGAQAMLKLSPAEAMRPERPQSGGRILLERVSWIWSQLDFSWRLALRSVFRSKVRTLVGVFAATMGSALLTLGLIFNEAAGYLVDFQFHRLVRSDFDLTFRDEQNRDALGEVARLPAVDLAEPTFNFACDFVNGPYKRKGGITGIIPGAQLTVPRDSSGNAVPIPSAGLVMSRHLANILHVKVGDRITLVPVQGDRRPLEASVVRVVDTYLGLTVYADLEYLSRLAGETFVMNGAQVLAQRDPEQLKQLYREIKQLPEVEAVVARRQMIETLTETIVRAQRMSISMLVGFAGVIFFGSVLNASLVSLAERQREVATFAALGHGPWQIGGTFLRETMVTNMVGCVLGMPLGYYLVVLLADAFGNELIRLPVVVAPWIWWATPAMCVLFVLLAHAFVQRQIHTMNYMEALQVKE